MICFATHDQVLGDGAAAVHARFRVPFVPVAVVDAGLVVGAAHRGVTLGVGRLEEAADGDDESDQQNLGLCSREKK